MFEIYGGPLVGVRTYSNSCLPLQKRNYTYDSDEDNIPDTNHSELVPEEDTPPVNPLPQDGVNRALLSAHFSVHLSLVLDSSHISHPSIYISPFLETLFKVRHAPLLCPPFSPIHIYPLMNIRNESTYISSD